MPLPLHDTFLWFGSILLQKVYTENVLKAPESGLGNFSFPKASPTIKGG